MRVSTVTFFVFSVVMLQGVLPRVAAQAGGLDPSIAKSAEKYREAVLAGGLATVLLGLGLVVACTTSPGAAAVALVAVPLGLAGCVLLSRVVTRLGTLPDVTPEVIEGLFASDFGHLQALYRRLNLDPLAQPLCPSCGAALPGEVIGLGGAPPPPPG